MASSSMQPGAASNKLILTPTMTLKGHEPFTHYYSDGEQITLHHVSICYLPDGEQMISGSRDKTIRRWDLRAAKEIEEVRNVCEQEVYEVVVSKDGRWVVSATTSGYSKDGDPLELKVCEDETGIVRTFELCSSSVTTCIDISADSTLLACGSGDNTTRIWNLDTGKLVAGPFKSYYLRGSVRLSHDSKKLAVNSAQGRWLEVWDVKTQKLDVRVGKNDSVALSYPPVFWTTKDKTIVSAFNFDEDTTTDNLSKTIYEFDASTLQTVGGPFEGHTSHIYDLALSFDCALLASASRDEDAIKLWAFESRQLLASFDVHQPIRLLFSPNSHQLAYTNWENTEIRIYDIPSEIHGLDSEQEAQPNNSARKKDLLNSDATRRAVRRKPVISPVTSFAPRPLRPSPMTYPQERDFLRYLRKVLPSRTNKVRNVQPRDPLDFPVTSPLPQNYSHSAQETTRSHSRMNPHENSRPPITQSSSTASTSFKARLRTGHGLPPVVDVPLAQGRERNAAAGAPPKNGEGWIPDEDFVPSRPPSPNPNSQPLPAVQINTGEHGRVGRLCFCF